MHWIAYPLLCLVPILASCTGIASQLERRGESSAWSVQIRSDWERRVFVVTISSNSRKKICLPIESTATPGGFVGSGFPGVARHSGVVFYPSNRFEGYPLGPSGRSINPGGVYVFHVRFENFGSIPESIDRNSLELLYTPNTAPCRSFKYLYPAQPPAMTGPQSE